MSQDFYQSAEDEPHRSRARAILAAQPQVRQLFGRNPWTAFVMIAVLSVQTGLAALMGHLGTEYWWLVIIAAYGIGAFANHCMYVITHESCHNLIFKRTAWNRLVALFADLPNLFPGAMGFSIYHLKHHVHQGDYGLDGDLPSRWEAKLFGDRWWGKALWLSVMPIILMLRPGRVGASAMIGGWWFANIVLVIAYDLLIWQLFGLGGIAYLLLSFFFSIGLHPLGARWIQEHYTYDPQQETMSYYGPANLPTLNVGYHNEHHDFPSIPWNRLPQLRKMAPDFYDTLQFETSWTRLLFTFVFDRRYSLYSRVARTPRKASPIV